MFGIVKEPIATIYASTEYTVETKDGIETNIADELIYGTTCRILSKENGWCKILTFYGYVGYVEETSFFYINNEEELIDYLKKCDKVTIALNADILKSPRVQGVRIISLPAGALVQTLEDNNGWTKIKLLDGEEGFVPTAFLQEKRYNEEYLFMPEDEAVNIFETRTKKDKGGKKNFSLREVLDKYYNGDEELFRYELTSFTIDELDVQYRWGGRSSWGTDCSGLVFQAYLRAGILIYRDASIANGYSITRILYREDNDPVFDLNDLIKAGIKEGDNVYFPGHVGMYLGDGKYIHSTGKEGSNGVVINSFNPDDEDYREDLLKTLYAVGGVR